MNRLFRSFLSCAIAVICVLAMAPQNLRAQQAGQLDPSFNATLGLGSGVSGVVAQPDGKTLVFGSFASGVIRLNVDGTPDASFRFDVANAAFASINALALQPDGRVIISGFFAFDASFFQLARLNADGSLDRSFVPAANTGIQYGNVNVITVQPDGKVLLAARASVVRLNANGSLDTGFAAGAFGGTDFRLIQALAVQSNGKVLAAGSFIGAAGVPRAGLLRFNADGSLDTGFNPGLVSAAGLALTSLAVQPDDKILIAGNFTSVGGVARGQLARLNADGSVDGGFNPAVPFIVRFATLRSDGKIIVVGAPTDFALDTAARLNPDGSLDASFTLDPATPAFVFNQAVAQADGKTLIVSLFPSSLVRLDESGALDPTFQADSTLGANGRVEVVLPSADGTALVGGAFTAFNGIPRANLARLRVDGTVDESYQPIVDGDISAIIRQPDGKIILGGFFGTVNGVRSIGVARLDAQGQLDPSFVSPFSNGVLALALQPDGKLVVADFTGRVYRVNADGSPDAAFTSLASNDNIFGGDNGNASVLSLAVQGDGKILVGGRYKKFGGVRGNGLVRLNASGTVDRSFVFDRRLKRNNVNVLTLQPDGRILIGGSLARFTIAALRLNPDGSVDEGFELYTPRSSVLSLLLQPDGRIIAGANTLVRLNPDGSPDRSFPEVALSGGSTALARGLALTADSRLLVGGDFTGVGGVVSNNIVRLETDGSLDASFNFGVGDVRAAILQPDGKVIVGGESRKGLVRLNSDGSQDTAFNANGDSDGKVMALALQADGAILVGGEFTRFNGASATRLTRLLPNGSVDARFSPVIDALVAALAVQADGRIIIGGDFNNVNGQSRQSLARLNADGSLDPSFVADVEAASASDAVARSVEIGGAESQPVRRAVSPGAQKVRALAIVAGTDGQPDKLLVGGRFSKVSGVVRQRLAQLALSNGAVDGSFDPGAGPDEAVNALTKQPDGKVVIGGDFVMVGGMKRPGLARLQGNGAVDADFDAGLQTSDGSLVSIRSLVLTAVRGGAVFGSQADGRPVRKQTGEMRLVFGGSFGKVGDAVRQGVARLLLDRGAVDPNFDSSLGANGPVNALAPQADGRTIIAGGFNMVDQQPRTGIARLLGDNDASALPVVTLEKLNDASEDGQIGQLRLSRTGDASQELTVRVAYVGKASNGVDYVARKGTVKLKAGKSSKVIKIVPIDDNLKEGAEKVSVKLAPDPAYTISADTPAKLRITIQDND